MEETVTPLRAADAQGSESVWEIKVGQFNRHLGVVVNTLIFESDDCVVVLDPELDTYWRTKDDTTEQTGLALNRLSELESIPLDGLAPSVKLAFRTMVAEGAARALDDENDTSSAKMHARAEAFIRARLAELARSWYLTAGLAALLVAALVMGMVWWLVAAEVAKLPMALCAGAIGAAFSLIARLGSFPLDPAAGRRLHRLEAFARIVVGVLGAFLAFLAVKSHFMFEAMGTELPALLLIAFVAGSSERFVPNLVERLDGKGSSRIESK